LSPFSPPPLAAPLTAEDEAVGRLEGSVLAGA